MQTRVFVLPFQDHSTLHGIPVDLLPKTKTATLVEETKDRKEVAAATPDSEAKDPLPLEVSKPKITEPSILGMVAHIDSFLSKSDIPNICESFKPFLAKLLHCYPRSAKDKPKDAHILTTPEMKSILQIGHKLRELIKKIPSKNSHYALLKKTHVALYQGLMCKIDDFEFFKKFWKDVAFTKGRYSNEDAFRNFAAVNLTSWLVRIWIKLGNSQGKQKLFIDTIKNSVVRYRREKYKKIADWDVSHYFDSVGLREQVVRCIDIITQEIGVACPVGLSKYSLRGIASFHRGGYSLRTDVYSDLERKAQLAQKCVADAYSSKSNSPPHLAAKCWPSSFFEPDAKDDSVTRLSEMIAEKNVAHFTLINAICEWKEQRIRKDIHNFSEISFGNRFFFQSLDFIREHKQYLKLDLKAMLHDGKYFIGISLLPIVRMMVCAEHVVTMSLLPNFLEYHPTIKLEKIDEEILPLVLKIKNFIKELFAHFDGAPPESFLHVGQSILASARKIILNRSGRYAFFLAAQMYSQKEIPATNALGKFSRRAGFALPLIFQFLVTPSHTPRAIADTSSTSSSVKPKGSS